MKLDRLKAWEFILREHCACTAPLNDKLNAVTNAELDVWFYIRTDAGLDYLKTQICKLAARALEFLGGDPLDHLPSIKGAIDHAYAKHGREQWGRHEFAGIMKEEIEELKEAKTPRGLAEEATQIIAVCLRYLETGDRYQEREGEPP
jgi:hypothetical protein